MLQDDTWSQAPVLNEAREMCSGCALGDKLYVFNGSNSKLNAGKPLKTIEIIDANQLLAGKNVSWDTFEPENAPLSVWNFVCPIGPKQVLIFGGRTT